MEAIIMFPLLYDNAQNSTNAFDYNGYGFITECTEFKVTEERNGAYTFQAKIKGTDRLIGKIKNGAYIKAKANSHDNPQLFYIEKIEVDKYGDMTISGSHISRLFFQNGTVPMYYNYSEVDSPSAIMSNLQYEVWYSDAPYSWFNFSSNIRVKKEFSLGFNSAETFENILLNEENGLTAVFKAELLCDNFNINLLLNRGTDTHRIAFGSNISEFKQVNSINEYYTHIMPYAECETTDGKKVTVTATEPYLTNLNATLKKTYLFDCSSKITRTKVDPQTGYNFSEVRTMLEDAVKEYLQDAEQIAEYVNITVTLESELEALKNCSLCDKVTIVHKDGSEIESKIAKTVYDSISEKYTEIGIGEVNLKMSDFLKIKRRFRR